MYLECINIIVIDNHELLESMTLYIIILFYNSYCLVTFVQTLQIHCCYILYAFHFFLLQGVVNQSSVPE